MGQALGIDVGGTKIAAAVVDAAGRLLGEARVPTPSGAVEALVRAIRACADDAVSAAEQATGAYAPDALADGRGAPRPADIVAVGIGIPAQVGRDGSIPHCTNLPILVGSDVVRRLQAAFQVPVAVENDANLAALGEASCGETPTDSLVLITLGTGAGGGVVVDGQMLRGPYGGAAEIGHMVILADGPQCPCGQRGCLEALVAGPMVAARARDAMRSAAVRDSALWQVDGAPDAVTAQDVVAAARAGDPTASRIIEQTGRYLGAALSSLANIFAPARIAIGGGLGEAAHDLLLPVATEVMRRDALAGSVRGLVVSPATLGQAAGVVGAAVFAMEQTTEG